MECPSINQLRLSQASITAIEDIKRIRPLAHALTGAVGGGLIVNIFVGNSSLEVSKEISNTDFVLFAHAVRGVPDIYRKRLFTIAQLAAMQVHHPDEQRFWAAVMQGCKVR